MAVTILELTKPYRLPSQHKMEIFNETVLMIVFYTIICFSDFILSMETRQQVGYVTCGLVTLHFLVNLVLISRNSVVNCIRNKRFNKARDQHKKQRKALAETLANTKESRLQGLFKEYLGVGDKNSEDQEPDAQ